jgi:hypothetical protein
VKFIGIADNFEGKAAALQTLISETQSVENVILMQSKRKVSDEQLAFHPTNNARVEQKKREDEWEESKLARWEKKY